MNNSTFEKLRHRLQEGNPIAIRDILIECESHCISKLKQKAKCSKAEAEEILQEAILIFREKVLDKRVVAVANLKEYIFLTCWELWREKGRISSNKEPQIKAAFYEIAKKAFRREVQDEIRNGDPKHYERVYEASRWAFDRLNPDGKKILMMYYLHRCSFKQIAEINALSGETEAKELKSHYYDQWMNEIAYLMTSQ